METNLSCPTDAMFFLVILILRVGGQAEFVRVPKENVNLLSVPDQVPDEMLEFGLNIHQFPAGTHVVRV